MYQVKEVKVMTNDIFSVNMNHILISQAPVTSGVLTTFISSIS